jgi:hypothetical protein
MVKPPQAAVQPRRVLSKCLAHRQPARLAFEHRSADGYFSSKVVELALDQVTGITCKSVRSQLGSRLRSLGGLSSRERTTGRTEILGVKPWCLGSSRCGSPSKVAGAHRHAKVSRG